MSKRKSVKHIEPVVPEALQDPQRGERLHKVLAEAGVASRRSCEQIIEEGRVRVNGESVTGSPAFVDPTSDRIEVDGREIARPSYKPRAAAHTYVMLHKPRRVVTTADDPEGRRTVTDLIDLPKRLFPVGRLDADSTGLLLMTDDGELTNRLTHPRYEISKSYQVSVRGHVSDEDLALLERGLFLAHQKDSRKNPKVKRASMASVKVLGRSRDRTRGDRTRLAVTLKEGQNREIRRLLARLGYPVRRLKRTAVGPLQLKGLAVGEWRMLTGDEVRAIYKAAGLKNIRRERE